MLQLSSRQLLLGLLLLMELGSAVSALTRLSCLGAPRCGIGNLSVVMHYYDNITHQCSNVCIFILFFNHGLECGSCPTRVSNPAPVSTVVMTLSPINIPTEDPSVRPSPLPVAAPTGDPTSLPMTDPTQPPTVNPLTTITTNPTNQQTATPTGLPTVAPIVPPTTSPTGTPTGAPVSVPSPVPIENPTRLPTMAPTVPPTFSPTGNPTKIPTSPPSLSPTASPSGLPTVAPIVPPTTSPTEARTGAPVSVPSPVPIDPARFPTVAPTVPPTLSPTANPTKVPTSPPSHSPTASPSRLPTLAPIVPPTSSPTGSPMLPPSRSPTSNPTGLPTAAPIVSPLIVTSFDISFTFINVDPDDQATIRAAANIWETVIVSDLPDQVGTGLTSQFPFGTPCTYPDLIDDLHLCVGYFDGYPGDGAGGVLGVGGADRLRPTSNLPFTGIIALDPNDPVEFNTILHEMGHALGIGVLWEVLGVTSSFSDGCIYMGRFANAEYNALTGCSTIPLLSSDACLGDELMTARLPPSNQEAPLSNVTIGALNDLGYVVDYSVAQPLALDGISCPCNRRLRSEVSTHQAEQKAAYETGLSLLSGLDSRAALAVFYRGPGGKTKSVIVKSKSQNT